MKDLVRGALLLGLVTVLGGIMAFLLPGGRPQQPTLSLIPTPTATPTSQALPTRIRKITDVNKNMRGLSVSPDGRVAALTRLLPMPTPTRVPFVPPPVPPPPRPPGAISMGEARKIQVLLDTSTGRITSEYETDLPGPVSWSPRMDRIASQLHTNGLENYTIVSMDPTGAGRKMLLPADRFTHIEGFAWSPSGTRIAFTTKESNRDPAVYRGHLWVVNADGTGLRPVYGGTMKTLEGFIWGSPVWFPDGNEILVIFAHTGVPQTAVICGGASFLLAIDVSTGQSRHIPENLTPGTDAMGPVISPDGKKIVYFQGESMSTLNPLWVMSRDGTGQRELIPKSPDNVVNLPRWLGDSRHIVFLSGDYKDAKLWALDVETGEKTLLLTGNASGIIDEWVVAANQVFYFYRTQTGTELRALY